MARLLAIMGSGETSPTMVKTHRALLERVGGPAVLLDTPFGFQANADDLAARAVDYFRTSVGTDLGVVSMRRADADALSTERAIARLREAHYVFAGPGSPSYALRQWEASAVPPVLADKLASGGCITFASAAALTLGIVTVPVYEIYKVGAEPTWLPGLDLLAGAGLSAAVIPHYDNAEGGTHDTRFCYLGEDRLARLEYELPDGAFVLGVDEHTGLVLDLDDRTASVVGLGGVTIRVGGHSTVFATATTVAIDELGDAATGGGGRASVAPPPVPEGPATPFLAHLEQLSADFDSALARRKPDDAVAAALGLETLLVEWSRDPAQSDQLDRGRSQLRTMVVRLGEVAEVGARDPAEVVAPLVETLLALRAEARSRGDYGAADDVRDRLVTAGIEVRDAPGGSSWGLLA